MKILHIQPPPAGAASQEAPPAKPIQAPQADPGLPDAAHGGSEGAEQALRARLAQSLEKMNRTAEALSHTLKFTVTDSHRVIVKVVDVQSGEVIREIPPERLVEALESIEGAMGVLVDRKA